MLLSLSQSVSCRPRSLLTVPSPLPHPPLAEMAKEKWKVDVVVVVVVVVVAAGVVAAGVVVVVVGFLCFCACASSKPD